MSRAVNQRKLCNFSNVAMDGQKSCLRIHLMTLVHLCRTIQIGIHISMKRMMWSQSNGVACSQTTVICITRSDQLTGARDTSSATLVSNNNMNKMCRSIVSSTDICYTHIYSVNNSNSSSSTMVVVMAVVVVVTSLAVLVLAVVVHRYVHQEYLYIAY